jgi:hypothetical protein
MCGFVADVVDIEKLSAKQKQALRRELERRKRELQSRMGDLDRAIKAFRKKARPAKR